MTKNERDHHEIRDLLSKANQIAVISHVRPDGDAVGSMVGLGLALKAAGKKVQMVLVDGVPSNLHFLPETRQVSRQIKGTVDVRVVVDCSDLQRTGMDWSDGGPELNIDHHITNLNFGQLNWVEPEAVATCAILAEYLPEWGLPITENVAKALLTGIVSDTLGFRTTNVNPAALRLAAGLMEKGASLPDLYNRALVRRTFEAARFWGSGLLQLQRKDRLVWTNLSVDDRIKVNYAGNDDADLVNFLSTIDDSDIVVIFVEQKEGTVKVSWRGQPGIDVSQVALQFGGGGHPGAAGAMIAGPLNEVEELVLRATEQLLQHSTGSNGKRPTG